jgi:hypothetical protein
MKKRYRAKSGAIGMPMAKNKFGAKKSLIDGITFDSIKEGARYCDLKLLQRAGKIEGLMLQVRFDFIINGTNIGFYKADFEYVENGKRVIEDAKGFKTPVYKLKKKLMKAIHGIDIFET